MIRICFFFVLAVMAAESQAIRSTAVVRIHRERSTESDLYASVDAFGDTHNLALKKVLLPSVRVQELAPEDRRLFRTIDRTEELPNNRFYFEKRTGALLYLNDHNTLEGMLTNSLALRYENNRHVVTKIGKEEGKFCEENTTENVKFVPTDTISDSDTRQDISYSVEVTVMVDSVLYNKFASKSDMIDYLRVYWYLVDRRFKTLNCATISILLTDILYSTSPSQDRHFMDATSLNISNIQRSLYTTAKFFANTSLSSFDLAHVMSGRDFYSEIDGSKRFSTSGMAYLSSVCKRYSTVAYNTGVSEDSGFYSGVMTTAHEIGHNLGAEHDGTGRASGCSATDGHLMSYETISYRDFYFSPCSSSAICGIYDQSFASCLRSVSNSKSTYSLIENLVGSDFSLDEQCQFHTGKPNAYVDSTVPPDQHCFRLTCKYQEGKLIYTSVFGHPAIEGTYCYPVISGTRYDGERRQCIDGRCQISSP